MSILIGLGTLLILIIVVFRIAQKDRKEEELKQRHKESLQAEASQYSKHINESLQIMGKTKNLETLKSRFEFTLQRIEDMESLISRGYDGSETNPMAFRNSVELAFNERLVEMAKQEYDKIMIKKDSYATLSSALNGLTKASQKIAELKLMIYQLEHSGKMAGESIDLLIENISKQIVFGKVKDLIEKIQKEQMKDNTKKVKDYKVELQFLLKQENIIFDENLFSQDWEKSQTSDLLKLIELA
ncbi:hypothetical protein EXM22_13785 [Oceanispirochaeta crateris]|uniref:Uncharacterized protein n=1 Tax=Oceanispirochaeta crateris TaxID=2518645 RepID=A0A5C1QN99_9SPIO|nr:hypothetical protein [Oceanispirochaeta crateris]QEN09007.1 hypothetical protein EXM22_13785 [Oceanispirochaeta crateris]